MLWTSMFKYVQVCLSMLKTLLFISKYKISELSFSNLLNSFLLAGCSVPSQLYWLTNGKIVCTSSK